MTKVYTSEIEIPLLKIITLGNSSVGKTSIIKQYTNKTFEADIVIIDGYEKYAPWNPRSNTLCEFIKLCKITNTFLASASGYGNFTLAKSSIFHTASCSTISCHTPLSSSKL